MFSSEQRLRRMLCTLRFMQLQHYKTALAAVWVFTACAAGLTVGVTSMSAWSVVAAIALLPPLVMLRFWQYPPQSISESIREARR